MCITYEEEYCVEIIMFQKALNLMDIRNGLDMLIECSNINLRLHILSELQPPTINYPIVLHMVNYISFLLSIPLRSLDESLNAHT